MDMIMEIFSELETEQTYDGYFYDVGEIIVIVILGSICGLRNIKQIHQWATSERVSEFLKEKFKISRIPCYYWLICIIKMIKPQSLNMCFTKWVMTLLPDDMRDQTLSLDGKTVRSTAKMKSYESPLHIVSAQLGKLGLTFGQKSVAGKSNEIPAVQALLEELEIAGCVVVADALNCQKETARIIVEGGADYLLSVKDNQPSLKTDIEEYVQDETLRRKMESAKTKEKSRNRIETRTAYVCHDVSWIPNADDWKNLSCFGAICTQFQANGTETCEWHYYISSRKLKAEDMLKHARAEWTVESMHWLLDVHFNEDFCRVEDKNVQQNLNTLRKMALNFIKLYKQRTSSKRPLSNIMFDCLLDCNKLLNVTRFET